MQKAVRASSSLIGIATCADEEALRAADPPPKTAEAKAKIAAIREKLTEVAAFSKTGKYREGSELARKLEEEATAVGYRPVQAETLYWPGELLDRTGEYKEAETTLYRAARAAGESRDGVLAAELFTRASHRQSDELPSANWWDVRVNSPPFFGGHEGTLPHCSRKGAFP